jgi:hypothetical protein
MCEKNLLHYKKPYKFIPISTLYTYKVRIRVLMIIRPIVGTIYFVLQVLMKN